MWAEKGCYGMLAVCANRGGAQILFVLVSDIGHLCIKNIPVHSLWNSGHDLQ